MHQIMAQKETDKIPAIFQLGFRVFFLGGSLFCVIALFLWAGQLFQGVTINPLGGSFWWHSHEMIFGFSLAIITGFLLTAVQTWTGIPGIKGTKLALLFLVWLMARVLLLYPFLVPSSDYAMVIISIIDLIFIPIFTLALAYPIIMKKQWRNLIFIPILLLLFAENLLMHWSLWFNLPIQHFNAAWSGVFTIVLLISVMGGRVIPFFTARTTGTQQPPAIFLLETLAIAPLSLVIAYFMFNKPAFVSKEMLIALFSLTALFQLLRMLRWQFWLCFKEPLLWSLHGSYFFIPIGLTLLALHHLGFNVTTSQALHSLTVGTIGGLILSMVSRVSLGHTGRKLETLTGMRIAFILMIIAGLIRSPLAAFDIMSPIMSLKVSFICFIVAYSIFLRRYIPILSTRRTDGKPG